MEAGKEGGQMIDLSVIVHSLAMQGRRQEAQPGSSSFIPGKDLSLAMSTNQSSHTTPNPGPVTLRDHLLCFYLIKKTPNLSTPISFLAFLVSIPLGSYLLLTDLYQVQQQ